MLSLDIARIAEAARADDELPVELRAMLAKMLDACAAEALTLERLLAPQRTGGLPEGVADLRTERMRRRLRPQMPAEVVA